MKGIFFALALLTSLSLVKPLSACSVLYYVDPATGKIYVANNEDYWYDTKAYIRIEPASETELARLWYGWDKFAQGGVNEAGLFFDGAVTPEHTVPEGFGSPKGNLGDEILAYCKNVEEALAYLEKKKIGLTNAHMMLGDREGKAVVVEWVAGERKLVWLTENHLIMTNYLLTDPEAGNHPCYRYQAIDNGAQKLLQSTETVDLAKVGNLVGPAVQLPQENESGRVGGTIYTSFINLTDMEFVLVFKLNHEKLTKLDLREEFARGRRRKIRLR
jgi:hypothetical protein